MNQRIESCLQLGKIAILEGGTRTRQSQAETLKEINLETDGLRIYKLELPFTEVFRRAMQRRSTQHRYDDNVLIASAKLIGQYKGMHSSDAPRNHDSDVTILDASQPTNRMFDVVVDDILTSR